MDYEPLYYRVWNGTYDLCLTELDSSLYSLVVMQNEDVTCTAEGSEMIEGIPAINMTSVSGVVACGKRGGTSFLDTVRVDEESRECPNGMVPCSDQTQPSETVCVDPDKIEEQCPILDFFVIGSNAAISF